MIACLASVAWAAPTASPAPVTVAPGPGPAHGQHTDAVLAELGYSSDEIARLRQAGALG